MTKVNKLLNRILGAMIVTVSCMLLYFFGEWFLPKLASIDTTKLLLWTIFFMLCGMIGIMSGSR